MTTTQSAPENIDEYVSGFPHHIQEALQQIRSAIREAAPQAEETISYKMPTFNLNGKYLVYFAGYKNHVSLYPAPIGNPEFEQDIAPYASGKGTLKLPLNKPMPLDLVMRVVKYRMDERRTTSTTQASLGSRMSSL